MSAVASDGAAPRPDHPAGPTIQEPILELVDVRAGYGPIEVLHGVDLQVPPGAVVALLGPNGGGKTTTLGVCSGLHPVMSGELRIAGCLLYTSPSPRD